MSKTLKTTAEIRMAKNLLDTFEKSVVRVLQGSLFKGVSMSEKILYITEMSNAKSNLWEKVYRTYPEVIGKSIEIGLWKMCKSTINGKYYFRAYCNPCLNKKRNQLREEKQNYKKWKRDKNKAYYIRYSSSEPSAIKNK